VKSSFHLVVHWEKTMRIDLTVIVAVLALALVAWLGRYQLVPVGQYGTLYKLDRWTGKGELVETQQRQNAGSPYGVPQYGQPR
jgi:hypothetical protein